MLAQFCGVNNEADPAAAKSCEAQDAINVESDKNGTTLRKRNGTAPFLTLAAGTAVNSIFALKNTSGNECLIIANNVGNLYRSVNAGSAVSFSTITSGARLYCQSDNGKAYCFTSSNDTPFSYDCATYYAEQQGNGYPNGKFNAFTQDRQLIAGATDFPNRLYLSQAGAVSTYTGGTDLISSWTEDIGRAGDKITGVYFLNGRVIVFKEYSVGGFNVTDQFNSTYYDISNRVGIAGPESVLIHDGLLYFKGSDNEFYRMDGTPGEVEKLSGPLRRTVAAVVTGKTRYIILSEKADWDAGNYNGQGTLAAMSGAVIFGSVMPSSATGIDTSSTDFSGGVLSSVSITAVPGSITISTKDSMSNGGFEEVLSVGWRCVVISSASGAGSDFCGVLASTDTIVTGSGSPETFGATAGTFSAHVIAGPNGLGGSACNSLYGGVAQGYSIIGVDGSTKVAPTSIDSGANQTCANATEYSLDTTGYAGSNVMLRFHTCQTTTDNLELWSSAFTAGGQIRFKAASRGFTYQRGPTCIDSVVNVAYYSSATFTSRTFDTAFSTPIGGPFSSTFTVYSGSSSIFFDVRDSADNVTFGSWQATSDTLKIPLTKRYWQWRGRLHNVATSTTTPAIGEVGLPASTTGQYITSCVEPGTGITSWGALELGGSFIGSGTNFSVEDSTGSSCSDAGLGNTWATTSTGTTISIATAAAYKARVTFRIGSASDTARMDNLTVNWTEGSVAPPSYVAYWDDGIYFSISTGTAGNNRVVKYDLRNASLWPFDMGWNSPVNFNNILYFGSTSTAKVLKYSANSPSDAPTSDDGSAINAYWRSKNLTAPDPFFEKSLDRISIMARKESGGTLTTTWRVNGGNTNSGSFTVQLSTGQPVVRHNYRPPVGQVAGSYDVQVGNNSVFPFEVLGLRLDLTPREWRPLP